MAKSANDFCNAVDRYLKGEITYEELLKYQGEGYAFRNVAKWPEPRADPTQTSDEHTFNQSGRGPKP